MQTGDAGREQARQLYQRGVQADPDYIWNYIKLGHLAREAHNFDAAASLYQTAAGKAPPGEAWPGYCLALNAYEAGNLDQARTYLALTLRIDPTLPDAQELSRKLP